MRMMDCENAKCEPLANFIFFFFYSCQKMLRYPSNLQALKYVTLGRCTVTSGCGFLSVTKRACYSTSTKDTSEFYVL